MGRLFDFIRRVYAAPLEEIRERIARDEHPEAYDIHGGRH